MRSLTVRLSDQLAAEIEMESWERNCAKSDSVRERLQGHARPAKDSSVRLGLIADLIASIDGLPADLSQRKKSYLKTMGYGKKRSR